MLNAKKITAMTLSGILALGALSGCGEKKQTAGGDNEAVEMTMHMHFFGYCVFDDEWPVFQEAAKRTGVSIKGTAVETVSDSAQAFSTMLADKKLPDIIHYQTSELNEIGPDGALIPLDDLIEEHAPNIKKFFEDAPEAKAAATAGDGHIYSIPGTLAPVGSKGLPSQGFFIRQDWLDKLGLETPKTVDEFYNVLKAFRDKDPNGNGKQDEIPYFDREGIASNLYQLFGARTGAFADAEGKIVDGRITEEYKNAIREVAKWYKEGLVDPEIFTRGQQSREQLLSTNLGGSTHDWFSSTASYNDKYPEVGLEFITMLPPADINGVVKEDIGRSLLHGLAWGISKDNADPVRTIKYFDWWLSEEGIALKSNGIEGVHYNMVDGQLVFTDEVMNADGGAPGYMRNQGCVEIGSITTLDCELAGMNQIGKDGFNSYNEAGIITEPMPILSYSQEELDVKNQFETNVNTYAKEQEQKWIMGAEDVDATWDAYVAQLKTMGIDDLTTAAQSAYDRYLESTK